MSDEEEDYMSDKFLSSLTDVRPSLIHQRARKREADIANQKQQNIKKQREAQVERKGLNRNERLQESLQKPIDSNNKGFQMLAKMGFRPGSKLGKDSDNSDALKEPIGISIKVDRGGLGREAALKELQEKKLQIQQQHLRNALLKGQEQVSVEEFRKRATQKAEDRTALANLRRCQLTCENMDVAAQIIEPELNWFWPQRAVETADEAESKDGQEVIEQEELEEFTNAEKLDMITGYLRTSYCFCFWCGVHYSNETDLNDNCPGTSKDDH